MTQLTNPNNPANSFKIGAGAQLGPKGKSILNVLRHKGRKNLLDLEMMVGPQLSETLRRMVRMGFISKCTHGSATGCYEITKHGRAALGEAMSLAQPEVTIICNATVPSGNYYDPAIHNTSRIGLAMA